jgi:hypothetical protein
VLLLSLNLSPDISGQLHRLATLPEGKNNLGIHWAPELFDKFTEEKNLLPLPGI